MNGLTITIIMMIVSIGLVAFVTKKNRLSLIHIQFAGVLTFAFIFADGVFYGLARHFSKSVVLSIILHGISNLGEVLERII